jgi:hypothetical protein
MIGNPKSAGIMLAIFGLLPRDRFPLIGDVINMHRYTKPRAYRGSEFKSTEYISGALIIKQYLELVV